MSVVRRDLLALPLAVGAVPAAAQVATRATWPLAERFPLWPAQPPGGPPNARPRGTVLPEVGVVRPPRPDGRGVLVVPGGGYAAVALETEGTEVAEALARQGITAFVLNYRLPIDGWRDRADVPLADAQRAMRLIRAGAARFRIDSRRVSVLGFSAGGHLAGTLATLPDHAAYRPIDAADRLPARPAAAALLYAVSNLEPGRSRGGSRANLLGPAPDIHVVARLAVDRHLTGAPPLFLAAAEDDATVPIVNTFDLAAAARRARVPVETHVFQRGGHGFGVRLPRTAPASLWPDLYARWLAETLSAAAG